MDKLLADLKRQIIAQLNLKDLKPEDIGDDQPLFVEGLGLDTISNWPVRTKGRLCSSPYGRWRTI